MPSAAKAYIFGVLCAGAATLGVAIANWEPSIAVGRFLMFVAVFVASGLLKGRVPGITGTYSPVFFVALLAAHTLPSWEALIGSVIGGVVQCTINVLRRPTIVQISFNIATQILSTASAAVILKRWIPMLTNQPIVLLLILAASVYYVVNTALISGVLTLVENKPLTRVFEHWYLGSLPYYMAGALIAGFTIVAAPAVSVGSLLVVLPAALVATLYYRCWLKNLRLRVS